MKKRIMVLLLIVALASLVATIAACEALAPTMELVDVESTVSSITFDVKVKDDFNVGSITKIELIHGNETVVADDLTTRRFDNLLSDNEYSVRVTYTYDLHDGYGESEIVKTASVKTLAKAVPTVEISNLWVTEDTIKADLTISDKDNVGSLEEIKLVDGTNVRNGQVIEFDNLVYGTTYELFVTYKYDLGDGRGSRKIIESLPITVDNKTIHQTSCKLDYDVLNGSCKINGYGNCTHEIIHIPEFIDGFVVTAIDEYAFSNCNTLTTVVIPKSVTTIGYGAFDSCGRLTTVTFDSGATLIKGLFRDCSSLETVTFASDSKLKTIGDNTFTGCSKLQNITIPESVTSLGTQAFYGCSRLRSIAIPKDVVFMGSGIFISCTSLENVIFEGTKLTSISDNAFYSCDSLTNIVIPEGVTDINTYAFYGCDNLTTVTIPQSVTYIGNYAFDYCFKLRTVYYGGTELQWEAIEIGSINSPLTRATVYYYSETREVGKWRYDEDGNPALWN